MSLSRIFLKTRSYSINKFHIIFYRIPIFLFMDLNYTSNFQSSGKMLPFNISLNINFRRIAMVLPYSLIIIIDTLFQSRALMTSKFFIRKISSLIIQNLI